MGEKRYYWLKLRNDFFDSVRMKKLRSVAGGDTYTIIATGRARDRGVSGL